MYKIISVLDNSVRVSTGGVTFDVDVIEHTDGKLTLSKPDIYVHSFEMFRRAVIGAFLRSREVRKPPRELEVG